ncbi:MAG: virulence factor Mce family protein [Marmoricola sp.]|nr:virulence factor Mce family protein [Marmoricola sp.]
MKIPHAAMPRLRLGVLMVFFIVCALFFGYLWTNMGGIIPGVSKTGYRVSMQVPDVDNLVYDSDVMVAGVRVGKVRKLTESDGMAHVVIQLNKDSGVTPLHAGAVVHVRAKTLIEETYLEITDGHGAPIADNAALPASAIKPSVQLDQVLRSLNAPTRVALQHSLQSLSAGTNMTQAQLAQTVRGLGMLGGEGHDALDALAAQSSDLKAMVAESAKIVSAMDTHQGQIVALADGANRLTGATAASNKDLQATISRLPGLVTKARSATGSLSTLSTALDPIAKNLRSAAGPLNEALVQLPAVTRSLRGLMPALNGTLVKAPATLKAVPGASGALDDLVPTARINLSDVNPVVAFLKPYGPDLAAFFTNWTAMLQHSDANGHYLRIFPVVNEQSVKGIPVPLPLNTGFLDKSNAYPAPGGSNTPGPFEGKYPRVEPDAR